MIACSVKKLNGDECAVYSEKFFLNKTKAARKAHGGITT